MDALEATTRALSGLVAGNLSVWVLWPLMGWEPTVATSVAVTLWFFALSWVLTYANRKLFRWLEGR